MKPVKIDQQNVTTNSNIYTNLNITTTWPLRDIQVTYRLVGGRMNKASATETADMRVQFPVVSNQSV